MRHTVRVSFRPARNVFTLVSFSSLFALCACDGCDTVELHDVSCHPGDPAQGEYDRRLEERCDNLLDDNCDGRINEGCHCVDGERFTCGSDIGECVAATVTCTGGEFPGCVPEQGPKEETCDGRDEDCDGEADEGLEPVSCWTGPDDAVLDGTAACRTGLAYCEGGRWSECRGETLPTAELCNAGIDDDCDGADDEDPVTDGRACGPPTDVGACVFGHESCAGGESLCVGAVYAQAETCDASDNDCDGQTDEELYRPCQTACGMGIERCSWGDWVDCSAPEPSPEVCDAQGIDEDCDGQANEGCPCDAGDARTCQEGMVDAMGNPISCGVGTQICGLDGQWGQCRFFGTEPEKCDAWDNDCDGAVDGFGRDCGDPLTAGIGECALGSETCIDGQWGECIGAVAPQDEVCDQRDNDCDGLTDEDLDPHDRVDMVFAVDVSGSMCPYIAALAQGIGEYVQDFQGTDHRFSLVVFPGDLSSTVPYLLVTPLTDAATFQAALAALGCDGGGLEPSYDVLYALLDPADPVGIGWRGDDPLTVEADPAYPYVILMGDENAQVMAGSTVSEQLVAGRASACALPGCGPGDAVETFGIIHLAYASQYDDITYYEPERLVEIDPPDADRYAGLLRDIFANVCLPPS